MRRNPETTVWGRGWARWALAGALALCWAGCESASRSNLSEYEKLVARRRTEAQARIQQASAPAVQKPAAPAKPAPQAQAKPQPKPQPPPQAPEKPQPKPQPQAPEKPQPKPAPAAEPVAEAPVEIVAPPAQPEPAPAPAAEAPVEVVPPPAPAPEPAPEPAPAAAAPARSAAAGVYRLARGDIVQIALRGIPEGQLIDDSLDEDGMISLPFIHEVYAEGLTASELEQRIRQIYRDSQIYPNVTVQVQVPTRYYYMQGEIRGPGKVQLVSATRLSQAIAASGGGTEFWNGKVLLRRNGEIVRRIKDAKRLEKYPDDDVLLEPGDIVELQRSLFW